MGAPALFGVYLSGSDIEGWNSGQVSQVSPPKKVWEALEEFCLPFWIA